MTIFIQLTSESDKATALLAQCISVRSGAPNNRTFDVEAKRFRTVPGSPFCYWASDEMLLTFSSMKQIEATNFSVRVGIQTSDDFRFLRLYWEPEVSALDTEWFSYSKGGAFSPFYANLNLVARWGNGGREMKAWTESLYGGGQHWSRNLRSVDFSFRPGITWPQRSQIGLSARIMPRGCLFGIKGPAIFDISDREDELLALLALMQSVALKRLIGLQMAFGSFDVGVIQRTPLPELDSQDKRVLSDAARRAWLLRRVRDSENETSRAFVLPSLLRRRSIGDSPIDAQTDLLEIQSEIDTCATKLYGLNKFDMSNNAIPCAGETAAMSRFAGEDDIDADEPAVDYLTALLSWLIGVAFGRFDWRLATSEREPLPEPDPFDPLPAKSPGMLPDGAEPFHVHPGILVDDPGHPHDLVNLVEEVLARVDVASPNNVRRWLQRDFFPFHLQRYSKSRRKAPIYWPLATASGSYTLWIYYPSLGSQTLYTAVNDFVEPRLKQMDDDLSALRIKGSARTRDDEQRFESLQTSELELIELRDTLLKLAPTYKPNHDDGVQITAAPLWPLFRHKPWQKVLKETSGKLEKGDYDWAHLAMSYWPDRVREKCKTDKSLAIAHGLEDLYVEPEAKPKKARGKK